MYSSFQVTCSIFFSDFSQVWGLSTDFHKIWLVSNFKDIRSVGDTLNDGQTDGRTNMTKPIGAFRNHANAPNLPLSRSH